MSQTDPKKRTDEIKRGQAYIAEIHKKMSRIAQEFAMGEINRSQFHHLYDRYQRQILTIAQYIAESDPSGWREAISDKESTLHIKKTLTAKAKAISLYDNRSGMPIETIGELSIDSDLIVPMLSSYRAAAAEIFSAGMRSTEMENGNWLCFVPGQYSTVIVLFTLEPSANQLSLLEKMHRDFETANKSFLENGYSSPDQLAFPFYSFINRNELGDKFASNQD